MLDFNLYLITDREQTAGRQLPAVVADALKGGVKCVQLREKGLSSRQLFELAVELRQLTSGFGAKLLINDRIDIALATEADGVHLGISSMPVTAARRLVGTKRLIGYSAHSLDEARQAERDGADFVTFGPVYHTRSKAAFGAPQGIGKLAETVRAISIPVFALGGVKKTSVPETLATGCAGVALISAIIGAADPVSETHIILKSIAESSRAC
jgi:thiamine-phosphate pyrophosphorylase